MAFERTKWIISALALTSVSSIALAEWQSPRQAPVIQKGASNTLRLQFRGFQPASVEVVIDGVVVASRSVSRGQTELQIGLRALGLAPGAHNAIVRYYDAQGRLLGEMQTAVDIDLDPSAPISIILPRNSATVSGTVPIEVRLNQSGQQYVTFYVNGQVRALRNFPPYVFAWDTTQEPNGIHTLEAQVFDGVRTFRTPLTRVRVNNPGGRTERQTQDETELPTQPMQSDAQVGLNEPLLSMAQSPMMLAYGNLRTSPFSEGRPVDESRLSIPSSRAELSPSASPAPSVPQPASPAPRTSEPSPTLAPNRSIMPEVVEEPNVVSSSSPLTVEEASLRASEAEPMMRGQKLQKPQIASAPAPTPTAKSAPTEKSWIPLELGARLPAGVETFEVALDASLITFDVAPQVEDGIPLVALRHVLEQAGGTLRWDNLAKLATAELSERIVQVDVRNNRILLNGELVEAEGTVRIVRGRVLVPASVFSALLNAEVAYDMQEGQVVISTNRE